LDERWQRAVERAREILEIYKSIPTGIFGAMMIQQDLNLYESGDRSEALLKSLENISE
jgi:hypothetical protein